MGAQKPAPRRKSRQAPAAHPAAGGKERPPPPPSMTVSCRPAAASGKQRSPPAASLPFGCRKRHDFTASEQHQPRRGRYRPFHVQPPGAARRPGHLGGNPALQPAQRPRQGHQPAPGDAKAQGVQVAAAGEDPGLRGRSRQGAGRVTRGSAAAGNRAAPGPPWRAPALAPTPWRRKSDRPGPARGSGVADTSIGVREGAGPSAGGLGCPPRPLLAAQPGTAGGWSARGAPAAGAGPLRDDGQLTLLDRR